MVYNIKKENKNAVLRKERYAKFPYFIARTSLKRAKKLLVVKLEHCLE